MSVRYTVVITMKDASFEREYITWLQETHVKDVVHAGGALSAEVLIKGWY